MKAKDWTATLVAYCAGAATNLANLLIGAPLATAMMGQSALANIAGLSISLIAVASAGLLRPLALQDRWAPLKVGSNFNWKVWIGVVVGPLVCVAISIGAFSVARTLFGSKAAEVNFAMPSGLSVDWKVFAATFGWMVLITPVVEEFIWRSWLFQRLRESGNLRLYSTLSIVGFAIAHMNQSPLKAITISALGALCCWLYLRTRGLLAPFLAHAGNNAIAIGLATAGY